MKKPKLYIIHGWTYTTAPWTRTIAQLEKKGMKIEMLNVPGLTTASKKVWTIEDYVRWADRNIPTGSVALGHSNGGRILLNLCSEKPDKLKHLILLDAAGVYETSNKRDVARTLSKKFSFLKRIPGAAKIWHKLTGATDYARAPKNMKQTLANMLESDARLDLTKVTTPTSILWGAADTVTPPRQAEVMHAQIPNSTLDIYPDWTHAPYLSHPDELARAIYRAYNKPPEPKLAPGISDTAAMSAALAMKKAPEPTMEAKEPNPIAPDLSTKLVLRKDVKRLTAGLRVSDAEAAAVKYQPKKPDIAKKSTNASAVSAALALKKDHKSAKTPAAKPETGSVIAELDQASASKVDFVPLEMTSLPNMPKGAITSASVPKVSRFEKAKRKMRRSGNK